MNTFEQTSKVHSAILVMDSRLLSRSIRGQNVPQMGWSRLYLAGPYYLDVNLKYDPNHPGARLVGQLVSKSTFQEAMVRLERTSGEWLEKPLEASGRFSLSLEPEVEYNLEFSLNNQKIQLGRFSVS